ncbi:Na+/H+ antiporter subunit E [Halobaculum marinum]|uniref:Na+/H+ antiporter subunit E n=1 Tax=Halobaculum marinum TaxID=3031996 RepID=A0ABD5WY14_9EURY|nr:Na+/H+ antiporter subunit E [Halobaculum sp. DT55]
MRSTPPTLRSRVGRAGATAFVAYAFYLALGDPTDPFDLVTGAASAVVVGVVLGVVAFTRTPTRGTLTTVARATVFFPVLLVAVVRANVSLARVLLDPDLPIEPEVVRVPGPEGPFGQALLANSITLTPGTLTLDIVDDELVVHTLTPESRADLESGTLQRWVAYVIGETSMPAVSTRPFVREGERQ